jgi:hypothetical protein
VLGRPFAYELQSKRRDDSACQRGAEGRQEAKSQERWREIGEAEEPKSDDNAPKTIPAAVATVTPACSEVDRPRSWPRRKAKRIVTANTTANATSVNASGKVDTNWAFWLPRQHKSPITSPTSAPSPICCLTVFSLSVKRFAAQPRFSAGRLQRRVSLFASHFGNLNRAILLPRSPLRQAAQLGDSRSFESTLRAEW